MLPLTPRSRVRLATSRFHRRCISSLLASGSPANRTQRNSLIRRVWATSPRLPSSHLSRAPRGRTENLLLPRQACSHLHLRPNVSSVASSPCGGRTQPGRLEKPMTSPEVERAVLRHLVIPSARTGCAKWAGRRSNPRLRFFRPPLDRLSYQPVIKAWALATRPRKRPGVALTPGLGGSIKSLAERHRRLLSLAGA
jgi:hypothetical protein